MLAPPLSPVPSINIEFCAERTLIKEPSSPFDNVTFIVDNGADSYRSPHLLPPPVHSPKDRGLSSPIQPPRSKGLDAARFEALKLNSKTSNNLRKEVAMRAHQSKQIERRNLFLSKIEAPPSPTAASLPVTPPESPAVFHFSLPSPGLVSPLALFETLDNEANSRPIRVEQVDFRARARKEAEALASLTGYMNQSLQVHGLSTSSQETENRQETMRREPKPSRANKALPSLDQISKRLGGNITIVRAASPGSRLPAFLQRSASPPKQDVAIPAPALVPTQTYEAPIPKYSFTPTNMHGPIARPASSTGQKASATRPPPPSSVTLAGPHIASTRPSTPLTAEALNALAYRAERGTVMMERLQRRFSAPARMTGQQNHNSLNQRVLARPVGGF